MVAPEKNRDPITPGTCDFICNFIPNMLLYNVNKKKEGEAMVELDQFKSILATYTEPLVEVRDSL